MVVGSTNDSFLLTDSIGLLVVAFALPNSAVLGPVVSNMDTSIDSPFPSELVLVTGLLPVLALGKSSLVVASVLPDSAVLRPSTVGFDVMN